VDAQRLADHDPQPGVLRGGTLDFAGDVALDVDPRTEEVRVYDDLGRTGAYAGQDPLRDVGRGEIHVGDLDDAPGRPTPQLLGHGVEDGIGLGPAAAVIHQQDGTGQALSFVGRAHQ
jgi:hypothetical protein